MAGKWHKLLELQLEGLASVVTNLSEDERVSVNQFLAKVNDAYKSYDDDRELLENSMELSSTELYGANKEMREQNLELKNLQKERNLILNSVGDGIYRIDLEGNATFMNPAGAAMIGWSHDEIIGVNQHQMMHHSRSDGSVYPVTDCPIYAALHDGSVHHVDNEVFWRKDGSSFFVDYKSTPLFENDKIVGAVVVFRDITDRLRLERELRDSAHSAGMSEIATGILHNVGNVLNSANVGLEVILQRFDKSVVGNLYKANGLLKQNRARLIEFLTQDPKGQKLIDFYLELDEVIKNEMNDQKREALDLMKKLQLIKDVINTQQAYAKGNGAFKENISLIEAVETALVMQSSALARHEIQVVKKFSEASPVLAQKSKLIHVALNLVKNAKEAMDLNGEGKKILTLEVGVNEKGHSFFRVTDSGSGIEKENLSKVFNHGFTTKKTGHGFGLHYCANAITEMGGKISVSSGGKGRGASFSVEFAETSKKVAA